MALRNRIILFLSVLLVMSGCAHTKDMEEKYLGKLQVNEIILDTSDLKIIINGHYCESAYGIDKLNITKKKDKLYITGKVKTGKIGTIDLKLDVPSDVNEVYFCSRKIWDKKSKCSKP